MAINFATFFTKAGKAFNAGNTINTAMATTIHDEVEDFVQEFGATDIEIGYAADGIFDALQAFKDSAAGLNSTVIVTALERYIVQTVKNDNPQADDTVLTALVEFIRQMQAASSTVDASSVSAAISYGASNAGNGVVVTSVKRGDGKTNELMFAEDIEFLASDATTFAASGVESVSDPLSWEWPGGSGASTTLASYAGEASYLVNGSFEDQDENNVDLPANWTISVGTLSTTINLTPVEVQTVVISGTPTSGFFTLSFTDRASKVYTTRPLAFNASEAAVQSALQALPWLENIEVETTGTAPNYTHTIQFYGVPNPSQLTSASSLSGGTPSIVHATTTAGAAYVMKTGARSLELDSNGVELTTLQQEVTLEAATNYAVCLFACVDVVPAAGVITVDLVDGVGGTVVADDTGASNSFTFNANGLTTSFAARTGVFRTPTRMPTKAYFRIRISTAVSNGTSVYLDDVQLTDMVQLYTGGPYLAVFSGTNDWQENDRITVAITNDRAGALHEWMDRVFALRENDLLLPSNSAGGETISDTLIA